MTQSHKTSHSIYWSIITTVIIAYSLIPVLWILSLSLKPPAYVKDGKFFPHHITLENYRTIFTHSHFLSALINSLGISLIATLGTVVIAMCASYAITRIRFPYKKTIVALILCITIFPQISLITPLFNMERNLGLFNTWPGLIIPYVTFGLPLAVFTLNSYFSQLPPQLEQAATMDGASTRHILTSIIFPLAVPGIVTTAILVFITCWNDLLLAISLTATDTAQTAPVAITNFVGASQFEEPTGSIAAGAMIITIPMLLFVLIFQRKIISGLTSGAVKG